MPKSSNAFPASVLLFAAFLLCLNPTESQAQKGALMAAVDVSVEGWSESVHLAASIWNWDLKHYSHTELGPTTPANAPFFTMGNSRTAGEAWESASKRTDQCVGYGVVVMGGAAKQGGANIPRVSFHAEKDGNSSPISRAKPDINGSDPVTVNIMWGFMHGQYSAWEFTIPYIDQLIRMGRPSKALDKSKAWLGNIDSQTGNTSMFPAIKEGSNAGGSWTYLPNRYVAYVWRAFNSHHPTRKIQGNPSEVGNSSPPSLSVVSPSRFYRVGGPGYSSTTDEIKTLSVISDEFTDYVSFEIYDGDNLLLEVKDAQGMNGFGRRVQFLEQRIYALHVIGTRKGGQKINSRPALLFVKGAKKGEGLIKVHEDGGAGPTDNGTIISNPAMNVTTLGGSLPNWTWKSAPMVDGFYDGTTFNLSGNGQAMYFCWDRGGFAYIKDKKLTGDFVLIARLKDAGDAPGSVGLTVKSGLSHKSPVLDLRWDWYWAENANTGLAWFNRHTPSYLIGDQNNAEKGECSRFPQDKWGGEHMICAVQQPDWNCLGRGLENRVPGYPKPEGIWLAVQRKGNIFHLFSKPNESSQWTKISPIHGFESLAAEKLFPDFILPEAVGGEVYAGFSVAGVEDGGRVQNAQFDNITLVYEPAAAAAWPGGDVTNLADVSGLATRAAEGMRMEGRTVMHLSSAVQAVALYNSDGSLISQHGVSEVGLLQLDSPLQPGSYQALLRTRDGGVATARFLVK